MQIKSIFLSLLILFTFSGLSFSQSFDRADSLRGSLRPERTCFDVHFYELSLFVDIEKRSIEGQNEIYFSATEDFSRLQLDLFKEMEIYQILDANGNELKFSREFNAVWVDFPEPVKKGTQSHIVVEYGGTPRQAKMPPWDGGFVWKEDTQKKPWVGVACEGIGASLWWPLKDHLSDEPDSLGINITVPEDLMAVCNGQLRETVENDKGTKTWKWFVSYPINSYNVTLNIADYVHLHDTYQNESGTHDLDYYVLRGNEEKAREHFQQVGPMMKIFEDAFGEYAFWDDGYALVETSYWGMEHQGAVAYGNKYKNNRWDFDYIIIHESGHEWWGNSVSCPDHAELWIHESFCTYSEAVYMEQRFGYDKMISYMRGHRLQIVNKSPIVGPKGVNYEGWVGSDMYYKGAWMLHSLRSATQNDALWWKTLKGFHEDHRISVVNTEAVIAYFNDHLDRDFTGIWQQYLYHADQPVLEYDFKKAGKGQCKFRCRWVADEPGFNLPVFLVNGEGTEQVVNPTTEWQTFTLNGDEKSLSINKNKGYFKRNKIK